MSAPVMPTISEMVRELTRAQFDITGVVDTHVGTVICPKTALELSKQSADQAEQHIKVLLEQMIKLSQGITHIRHELAKGNVHGADYLLETLVK